MGIAKAARRRGEELTSGKDRPWPAIPISRDAGGRPRAMSRPRSTTGSVSRRKRGNRVARPSGVSYISECCCGPAMPGRAGRGRERSPRGRFRRGVVLRRCPCARRRVPGCRPSCRAGSPPARHSAAAAWPTRQSVGQGGGTAADGPSGPVVAAARTGRSMPPRHGTDLHRPWLHQSSTSYPHRADPVHGPAHHRATPPPRPRG